MKLTFKEKRMAAGNMKNMDVGVEGELVFPGTKYLAVNIKNGRFIRRKEEELSLIYTFIQ